MSSFPNAVVHEVTGSESNLIYRALYAYGKGFDSGITRERVDLLLAKVAEDNRQAFLAQRAEARGADFLSRLIGTPDALVVAEAAEQRSAA